MKNRDKFHQFMMGPNQEGFLGRPYDDATGVKIDAPKGNVTIGIGYNTDANPISRKAACFLLDEVIDAALPRVTTMFPFWDELTDVEQAVVMSVTLNVGTTAILAFKPFRDLLANHDFQGAADDLMTTKIRQARKVELSTMLRTNKWPDHIF